jgi:hypothetical protein
MMEEAKLNVSKRVQVSPVTLAVTHPSGGITAEDARTVTSLIFALQGEWRCQIGQDGCGELGVTFDSSPCKRWRTLGIYDDVEGLASDLGDVVGWCDGDTSSRRCGSLASSGRLLA